MTDQPVPGTDGSATEEAIQALIEAVIAMLKALFLLCVIAGTLLARMLQAIFIAGPVLLKVAAAGLAVWTMIDLFQPLSNALGGDVPAIGLTLATILIVPASLLLLNPRNLWGMLLATGAVLLAVKYALPYVPPILAGAIPAAGLCASILQLWIGARAEADAPGKI